MSDIIQAFIEENYPDDEIVVFQNPSFESAFIGISHTNQAVYDYELMVAELVEKEMMTELEAVEFIDYNTMRSLPYVENSPIVVNTYN